MLREEGTHFAAFTKEHQQLIASTKGIDSRYTVDGVLQMNRSP